MKDYEKVNILLDEKKRLESHLVFIVKTYIYVYGFLFVYTGFVAKFFFSQGKASNPDSDFTSMAFSLLGLFLIIVVSLFGKYGTLGIAHIINRRLQYTYEINKILKRKNNLETEHFLKIPVIYTWTSTAIIAGSLFYFLIIFKFNYNAATFLTMLVCIVSLYIFSDTNIQFYFSIKDYSNKLKKLKKIEVPKKEYYDLIGSTILIYLIVIYIEIQIYVYDKILKEKLLIYSILFLLLIKIRYFWIKRKTNRQTIYTKPISEVRKFLKRQKTS